MYGGDDRRQRKYGRKFCSGCGRGSRVGTVNPLLSTVLLFSFLPFPIGAGIVKGCQGLLCYRWIVMICMRVCIVMAGAGSRGLAAVSGSALVPFTRRVLVDVCGRPPPQPPGLDVATRTNKVRYY